ncbi:hypothetical protein [Nocardioides sp.]|uniref:hypothetical protein n=1 Tax=Nocardioides sp. TaxID=35761 RepID=UPI002BB47FB7|nr:hypothetical protein [Nocardioides sp.]HXH80010.1 hypothetical protein [Nocardioides sp.]
MSERSLVVHQGSLASIETAMSTATTAITSQIRDLLEQVEALTPGWEPGSESHAAHLAYQQRLRDGIERLTSALTEIQAKVASYRDDAREIEVENVAIVN